MLLSIPSAIITEVEEFLKAELKIFTSARGGCINHGGELSTSRGKFFIKWNSAGKFPGMFEAEAKGLNILRATKAIHIPEVITTGKAQQFQFIILEYVEQTSPSKNYWKKLGIQLAALHKHSSETFGLDHNNYIGSLPQFNSACQHWVEFFIEDRLRRQLELGLRDSKINSSVEKQFELLFKKLPSLFPEEKPALLHGDLWSGNLIVDSAGKPCLIDPAVYYGNREIEIAFTKLFGGFDYEFYRSYDKEFPLIKGYEERFDLYNLYPLLVHVNLFGGAYLSQVASILQKWV